MGLHRETQRVGEMYFLLVLLLSPTYGMPSSAQHGVGVDIGKELEKVFNFTTETGNLLNNSKLFEKFSDRLKEAENAFLEMEIELKTMEKEVKELQFEDNYFPKYNEAKSYLRKTRSELRNLARRNVAAVGELKLLFADVDKTEDHILLQITILRMSDLMIETLESLEAARKEYKSALLTFENLISSVKVQNGILAKVVSKNEAEFEDWAKYSRDVSDGCAIGDWFTFGLCNVFHNWINKVPLERSRQELEKLKTITDNMLEKGNILDQAITEAIGILTHEIDLIDIWANSAELVAKNIEEYKVQLLIKYKAVRTVFQNGLDDLKEIAEKFLKQPVNIF